MISAELTNSGSLTLPADVSSASITLRQGVPSAVQLQQLTTSSTSSLLGVWLTLFAVTGLVLLRRNRRNHA